MKRAFAGKDIREAAKKSGMTMKALARKAGVEVGLTQRWVSGRQVKIDVDDAERIWYALTGKRFTR